MTNKIILRMCALTRNKKERDLLFRIVKTKEGILIQKDKILQGRGVYLSKDKDVILAAKKKKILSRHLKVDVSDDIYDELLNLL
jgi:predicted RNA-binding protein YlxR (DUF448 family)